MTIEIQWLGHATVLVEDRARILTDPLLTATLMHLHRRGGPVPRSVTSGVDAALVSHLHMDHLHFTSLAMLDAGTPVLIPRGGGRLLRRSSLDVVEVVAGDVVEVGGASVTVVPAVHDGRRWPWSPTRGEAIGFVVRGEGATYFAGDTSLFPEMADIADSLDVALLPVGGWGPSLRGHHMNPEDAAMSLRLLDPAVAVPIHYGTFWPRGLSWVRNHLFHEPGRSFAAHAQARATGRRRPRAATRCFDLGGALGTPERMGWLIGRVLFAVPPHDGTVGDHPSTAAVADNLQRPTRELGRTTLERSLSGLAPGGVCLATAVSRRAGGLLHHRFTLTSAPKTGGGLFSVALIPRVAPGGCCPPPRPVEPGPSSTPRSSPRR